MRLVPGDDPIATWASVAGAVLGVVVLGSEPEAIATKASVAGAALGVVV